MFIFGRNDETRSRAVEESMSNMSAHETDWLPAMDTAFDSFIDSHRTILAAWQRGGQAA